MTPKQLARRVARAAEETKALDIKVLDLTGLTSFTDYFVICSGRSDTQVRAIAANIRKSLEAKNRQPLGMEGVERGQWALLDYGDVVVHIFYRDLRDYYNLEKLWSDAPSLKASLR